MKRLENGERRAEREARGDSFLKRIAQLGGVVAMLVVAGGAAVGCAAEADGTDGDFAAVDSLSQGMHSEYWRQWGGGNTADTQINSDPTICANKTGDSLIAVRNSDGKYYVKRRTIIGSTSWKKFGDKQFASSVSCTMQTPYPGTSNLFLLAGKGVDNRLYVLEGTLPPSQSSTPPPPEANWTGAWAEVSATTYATNALPALASNRNRIALVFVNGNRVRAHHQMLPYASNKWNATPVQSPTFPAGVTVSGVPAITYLGGTVNKFAVMVRGVAEGTAGLYWIYYNGTSFEGTWIKAFVPYRVDSDAAMEWDHHFNALTVYFRSGNSVLQTSVTNPGEIGAWAFWPIPHSTSNTTIHGAPRVVYGGGAAESNRVAVVRGFGPGTPFRLSERDILIAETTRDSVNIDPRVPPY